MRRILVFGVAVVAFAAAVVSAQRRDAFVLYQKLNAATGTARVDLDDDHDFTDETPMKPYKDGYQIGYFGTDTPASAADWHAEAKRQSGSWWEDWAKWIGDRAGAKRQPPGIGSKAHPPLGDAPGTYVHAS